jgi:hypothetical protein
MQLSVALNHLHHPADAEGNSHVFLSGDDDEHERTASISSIATDGFLHASGGYTPSHGLSRALHSTSSKTRVTQGTALAGMRPSSANSSTVGILQGKVNELLAKSDDEITPWLHARRINLSAAAFRTLARGVTCCDTTRKVFCAPGAHAGICPGPKCTREPSPSVQNWVLHLAQMFPTDVARAAAPKIQVDTRSGSAGTRLSAASSSSGIALRHASAASAGSQASSACAATVGMLQGKVDELLAKSDDELAVWLPFRGIHLSVPAFRTLAGGVTCRDATRQVFCAPGAHAELCNGSVCTTKPRPSVQNWILHVMQKFPTPDALARLNASKMRSTVQNDYSSSAPLHEKRKSGPASHDLNQELHAAEQSTRVAPHTATAGERSSSASSATTSATVGILQGKLNELIEKSDVELEHWLPSRGVQLSAAAFRTLAGGVTCCDRTRKLFCAPGAHVGLCPGPMCKKKPSPSVSNWILHVSQLFPTRKALARLTDSQKHSAMIASPSFRAGNSSSPQPSKKRKFDSANTAHMLMIGESDDDERDFMFGDSDDDERDVSISTSTSTSSSSSSSSSSCAPDLQYVEPLDTAVATPRVAQRTCTASAGTQPSAAGSATVGILQGKLNELLALSDAELERWLPSRGVQLSAVAFRTLAGGVTCCDITRKLFCAPEAHAGICPGPKCTREPSPSVSNWILHVSHLFPTPKALARLTDSKKRSASVAIPIVQSSFPPSPKQSKMDSANAAPPSPRQ